MNRVIRRASLAVVLATSFAASRQGAAFAQSPNQGFPKEFKNLQVIDKKIAPDELKKMMNGFTEQLGVKCTFCHNLDNYASDERKHKGDARKMITLVQHMKANKDKYFKANVTNDAIACGTCHRGKEEPEPFIP